MLWLIVFALQELVTPANANWCGAPTLAPEVSWRCYRSISQVILLLCCLSMENKVFVRYLCPFVHIFDGFNCLGHDLFVLLHEQEGCPIHISASVVSA